MKNSIRLIYVGVMGCLLLAGCSKEQLETSPTTSMSGTSLMANGNAALVPLNGIYRSMYTSGWSTTGNTHQCFGISAYNLMADVMGEDMVMAAQGSGWFWYDCLYNVKSRFTSSTWRSYDLWNAYYTWISNANYILAAEETMEGTSLERGYALGQAYAIRAYSYFMLAQSFARTYKGHESEACCPIYMEPTTASTKGQPRSSVKEVYDLILADINKAIDYLKGTTKKHASHISYDVALGLKARIALTMEDWSTAKAAAKDAIGATSAVVTKVADFAGVNSVGYKNVMWGAEVIADQSGMYAGFFTHMDADAGAYGSTAQKRINTELYARIRPTDDRLAWWDSANSLQQEKFKFSDISTWLGDYVWMRVEEMYLIAAEAECRLGEEDAAKTDLMALMSKRDSNYTCSKTGTALGATTDEWTNSLLEEILIQRRIELWGEAGRVYDIRRLKQGFKRTAAMGWPASAQLSGRPTDDPENYMWVLTIPQSEFDGNENMTLENDQNPTGDK
ncbi:MAG: RagB/SusD family nutrient uptake outer membrane protein [Bacteroidales bacterium]|nr:RagB/SusD family nutrient uptake outer membrane protein [Bacteroidales bacterium]